MRRQEDMEKRKKDDAEKERLAAEAAALEIERDLATREPVYQTPASSKLVWLHEHKVRSLISPVLAWLRGSRQLGSTAHEHLSRSSLTAPIDHHRSHYHRRHTTINQHHALLTSSFAQSQAVREFLVNPNPDPTLTHLQLPDVKPLEFLVNASTLPPDAHVSLARIAKELQVSCLHAPSFTPPSTSPTSSTFPTCPTPPTLHHHLSHHHQPPPRPTLHHHLSQVSPELKLHIAGHSQTDEDAKLASQRAQAVGAALIALGAMPSKLRAKGYGATVTLSAAMRARLRLKSDRRVGLHAISEVGSRYGCEVCSSTISTIPRSLHDPTISPRSHDLHDLHDPTIHSLRLPQDPPLSLPPSLSLSLSLIPPSSHPSSHPSPPSSRPSSLVAALVDGLLLAPPLRQFAAKATNVSDHALELLREIATLCRENRTLRLSVEVSTPPLPLPRGVHTPTHPTHRISHHESLHRVQGHTDDRGEPAENAKLSVSR